MVHQYKLNGYNLVLDTCSGGVQDRKSTRLNSSHS